MTKELCKPCAIGMEAAGKSAKRAEAKSRKITCAECGRRRFGSRYEVTGRIRKASKAIR